MIQSHIINLDRNPDRMAFVAARFEELGLPFQRFQAVDGKAIPDEEFKAFAAARPRVKEVGKWTKGKMGCDLSHIALWKIAANSDDPYTAIFEDDVIISDFMPTLFNDTSWIPEDCDIVRLESTAFMTCLLSNKDVKDVKGRKLHKILPNKYKNAFPLGAGAYIIKKEAAQKILDAPPNEFSYTDRSLFDYKCSGVPARLTLYQITPACCVQDKFYHDNDDKIIFKSEIETSDHEDIYDNHNKLKYMLRKYGTMIGVFQIFAILRRFTYYINGYRKVPYQE